jgi:hypothetical protein
MLRKVLILGLLVASLSALVSCASKTAKTELDLLYESNFEGLSVPTAAEIKRQGEEKQFPHTTLDEVWDSAILVLMQRGVIARSQRDSLVVVSIAAPPAAIFMEEDEGVRVYIYWMQHLYRQVGKPDKMVVEFTPERTQEMTQALFDRLATQVYSGQKWKYLQGQD